MAYDYSSSDRQLNLPNPLKVENIFLALSALLVGSISLVLLFNVRATLPSATGSGKFLALGVGIALLTVSVYLLFRMLTQLRFYFGRGRPDGLAAELAPQQVGITQDAQALSENMRQQALVYPEPTGALSGLLYSHVPNLIFAPIPLQQLANRQFKNAVLMLVLLASLTFALLFGRVGADDTTWQRVSQWIGLIYLVYVGVILLQPSGDALAARRMRGELTIQALVITIAFAIVGPVLLVMSAKFLPDPRWLTPFPAVFVVMMIALVIYALFFVSLMRYVKQPPQTSVAMQQEQWNLNCHPNQINTELDRALQETWPEKIPNRRYARIDAEIQPGTSAGQFSSQTIEETQPFPTTNESISFSSAIADTRFVFLVALNFVGTLLWALCAGAALAFANEVLKATPTNPQIFLLYSVAFGVLARFAFLAAHILWNRFEFNSRLLWIEMQGQFTVARLDHGNQLTDTIRSSAQAIKIEAMTFRIWCANITSVTFGKDSARTIVAMAGDSDYAKNLTQRLRNFATNQASIFTPTADADLERHAKLVAMNAAAHRPDALAALQSSIQAKTAAIATHAADDAQCPQCRAEIIGPAAFCSSCGYKLRQT